MEGLQNNFKLPNPDPIRNATMNNAMDSSFMSYLITDEDLEGLNTVNETVMDDYSQASTAILANTTQESVMSQIVTTISESSDSFNLLTSQLNAEPNSNFDFSRTSIGSPGLDLTDEDILPPSPNPPLSRTPSSSMRSSAFVTMAIGSPVQGSLRTLRNIEEAVSTPSTVLEGEISTPTPIPKGEAVLKKESNASFKAMRQIHFENDNSNHSTRESPSSFLSEPGRAVDSSIPKPTVNRLVEFSEEAEGIEILNLAEAKQTVNGTPVRSSLGNIFPQSCEADSASQSLTPKLTVSQPECLQSDEICSQNLTRTSPSRNPDSQSYNLVECFNTQDLLPRTTEIDDSMNSSNKISSLDSSNSKLELILDSSSFTTPELQIEESPASSKGIVGSSEVEMKVANEEPGTESIKEDCKASNETVERVSSLESTPEVVREACIPFDAIIRFYNPLEKTWVLRTTNKSVPVSKLESLMEGSVSDYLKMGLFDNMESEIIAGSRLDPFSDLLQRQQNSSSGYNADISGSSKSDSIVSRSLRLSTASTFDSGPIACSSLLSRTSLESGHSIHSEFAVPKKPVLRPKLRGGAKEQPVGAETAESLHSEAPDSTELPEDVVEEVDPVVKVTRKRGRKPKIPDVIRESTDSSSSSSVTATPPKKGRRGRPLAGGTPDKRGLETSSVTKETEKVEGSEKLVIEKDEHLPSKSSDDYLEEAEDDLSRLKSRSYETGKAVFAQWMDKCFYAAKITQRDATQPGKWNVKFEDGQTRSLAEEFILPVSILNKNQSVLVLNEDLGEGRSGIVIAHQKGPSGIDHVVEMDNGGTLAVPRHRICMTQDQMQYWNVVVAPQLFSPHTCNVSLDNILGGKRRTRSITETQFSSPVKTPRTATPRTPRTPRSRSIISEEAGTPTSSRATRAGSLRKKLTGKRDLHMDSSTLSESSGASMQQIESNLRSQMIKRMSPLTRAELGQLEHPEEVTPDVDPQIDYNVTGPLPANEQLFVGFAFILTKTTKELNIDADMISDDVEPYLTPTAYHKDYLRKQLEKGGGVVLERFEHATLRTNDKVVVIANRPCRTERYIRAIAANIRAVSHDWVYQCCQRNELLAPERYFLPPGIDVTGQVVEWSQSTGRCFSGVRILLQGPGPFCDLWQPILVQAQCVVVFRFLEEKEGSAKEPELEEATLKDEVPTDYVVTTKECPAKIVDSARRMNIPILSSEWVIQSLIHGKKLDHSSRREFDFQF